MLAVKLYGRQFSSVQSRRALGKAGQGRVRTEKWWRRSRERRGGGGRGEWMREDYGQLWNMGRAGCWSWEVEEREREGIKWDTVAMALRCL